MPERVSSFGRVGLLQLEQIDRHGLQALLDFLCARQRLFEVYRFTVILAQYQLVDGQ